MKAITYARCSTNVQDTAAQAAACHAEIIRRGWESAGEFVDDAVSGMTTSRPGFDAMMAAVRAGTVDAVVAAAGDRLGRSTIHVLQIEEELRTRGVALVLLRGNVDTSTSAGRLTFTLLAGMAQFERDLISDRTKAALAHRRTQGVKLGRPRQYTASDQAIRALKLAEPHLSTRAIAVRLNASKTTVAEVLRAS